MRHDVYTEAHDEGRGKCSVYRRKEEIFILILER